MNSKEFVDSLLPFRDKLFRYARRVLQSYEEAEDIIQDVYLKLWANKEQLREKKNLEAFAMTVTKNLCIDRIRNKGYQASTMGIDATEIDIDARTNDPEKIAIYKDAADIVKEIIKTMPENMRLVVQLRDIEGLEYAEIVKITGSNVNTLKVNLSRARKKIREELLNKYKFKNYES